MILYIWHRGVTDTLSPLETFPFQPLGSEGQGFVTVSSEPKSMAPEPCSDRCPKHRGRLSADGKVEAGEDALGKGLP